MAEQADAALTEENTKALVDAALKAREKAYAPYSRYHVGAALLTSDGSIITGGLFSVRGRCGTFAVRACWGKQRREKTLLSLTLHRISKRIVTASQQILARALICTVPWLRFLETTTWGWGYFV